MIRLASGFGHRLRSRNVDPNRSGPDRPAASHPLDLAEIDPDRIHRLFEEGVKTHHRHLNLGQPPPDETG